MDDYVVVVVASVAGVLFLMAIVALGACYLKNRRTFNKKPERATSRVYPRISSPIYAISHNSIDKKSSFGGDTLRKLPMFDRKRPQAFQKSFYGHEDSPRIAHKEYLDFSQIDSILPPSSMKQATRPEVSEDYYAYRNNRNDQKSEDQGSFDSEETASTHMSKESLEDQPKPQLVGIGVASERPFSGSGRSYEGSLLAAFQNASGEFEPVREIYRENNVSYDKQL